MDYFPWTVPEVKIRCPCGQCFKDADTYLQHKKLCMNHAEDLSIRSEPEGTSRRASMIPIGSPTLSLLPRLRATQSAGNDGPFQSVSARKQHSQARLVDVHPTSPNTKHRASLPQLAAKIKCTCGRKFAKQESLNTHLRTSKAHQTGGVDLWEDDFTPLLPNTVQPTNPNALPPDIAPTSVKRSGTMPQSTVPRGPLLRCDCGHSFETQRILGLHKRNSLYHQRHTEDLSARQAHLKDSLSSAFASMTIGFGVARPQPSVANLTCICGCIFSTKEAFDQHNADAARYAWLGDRGARQNRDSDPRLG